MTTLLQRCSALHQIGLFLDIRDLKDIQICCKHLTSIFKYIIIQRIKWTMWYPKQLKNVIKMIQDYSFDKLLECNDLPPYLTVLQLPCYQKKLLCGIFPETLHTLSIGTDSEYMLNVGVLPLCLKKLTLISYSQRLSVGVLPDGLIELTLSHYNHEFASNVLPKSLKLLNGGNMYNKMILPGVLPLGLQKLMFGWQGEYNQIFHANVLPNSLVYLNCGAGYKQDFICNALPASLTTLHCGSKYNQVCKLSVLPSKLLILRFGNNYNQPLQPFTFECLIELDCGWNNSISIQHNVLPQSLQTLRCGPYLKQHFSRGILPQSLQKIYCNPKMVTFEHDALPYHTKVRACTFNFDSD